MKMPASSKRLQISKANTTIVIVVATAAFVTTFSLVVSKALLTQRSYQARVIAQKEAAVDQLDANIAAVDTLVTSYGEFVTRPQNVIGGSSTGTGPRDGDNAKIILDALPSKYDFPALATSLEALVKEGGVSLTNITGTDDEVAQQGNNSPTPESFEMPFQLVVAGNYGSIQDFTELLERSIRPFKVQSLSLTGDADDLSLNITSSTYYLPEKTLSIVKQEVK